MFRRLACAAVTVATLFVAISTLGPGGADADTTKPWPPAACATGRFTEITPHTSAGGGFIVHGEASACPRFLPGSEFAIVYFRENLATGVRVQRNIRKFYPESARKFGVDPINEPAMCLMSAPSRRLACAQVRVKSGSPVLIPLPTDDPLVTKPIRYVRSAVHPTCGGCY